MNVPAFLKKPAVQKALRIAGYALFGVAVFAISLVWTFPANRLRSFVEAKATRDGVVVHVEDLSIRGLSTLSMEGVSAEFPPEVRTTPDGREVRTPRTLRLERLDISVGLWRLLFGGLSLRVEGRSGGGIFGPVVAVRKDDRVEVEIERIRDFPIPQTFPVFGVSFSGLLDGKGRIVYDPKSGWFGSSGRLELRARDLVAVNPTLRSQTQGEATLTDVHLGEVTLQLNLDTPENIPTLKKARKTGTKPGGEGSVLHFEKAEVDGSDMKVLVENQSVIRFLQGRPIADAQVAVELAFALSDAFFNREVKSGGTTTTPNRFVKTLLDLDPRWRSASSGGYYGVVCSGVVRSPTCIPKKPSIRGGDFKRPEKPVEPAAPEKETPQERPIQTAPREEAPRAQPAVAPPQPVNPPPPPQPAAPSERPEPVSTGPTPAVPPPVVVPGPLPVPPTVREGMEVIRTVTPTIIGRPKLRGSRPLTGVAGETPGEEPPPTASPAVSPSGESPPAPPPAQENEE